MLRQAVTQLQDVVKPIPGQNDYPAEQMLAAELAEAAVELWQKPIVMFFPDLPVVSAENPAHRRYFDLELQLIVWQAEDIRFNADMSPKNKLRHFALLLVNTSSVHICLPNLQRLEVNSDWNMFAGEQQLQCHCQQAGACLVSVLWYKPRLIQCCHRDGPAKTFPMKLFKLGKVLPACSEVRRT